MIFLDVNTFYYASDGGVKTFYDAKINWFKQHPEHHYYLVYPNSEFQIEQVAPNIHKVQVFGLKGVIGKNRRLMLDYAKVFRLIRKINPDVLEIGDPLLSPLFVLFLRHTGIFKGILANFHHSDPLNTYVYPWAFQKNPNVIKKMIYRLSKSIYLACNRRIPFNMVASNTLKQRLEQLGIPNIVVKPFGVQEIIFRNPRIRKNGEKHLLFAGRLEHEKGIYQLKDVIHRLLKIDGVHVTVLGKGTHQEFFSNLNHPNFHYAGYIKDRKKVAEILRQHTVFLAPGPFETFGIGVLEAMSNGMIVVGPDSGGTGELLASMNSPFIFKAQDSESFYQKVISALNSDIETESKRTLQRAGDFLTWDTAIQRMMNHYIRQVSHLKDAQAQEKDEKSPDFVS